MLAHRSERYRREATRALRTSLPGLLGLPAAAIDAAAIRRALDAIPKPAPPRKAKDAPSGPGTNKARQAKPRGKEPATAPAIRGETMARRVRAYGAALFGWAVKRDLVPSNPFAGMPMESARGCARPRADRRRAGRRMARGRRPGLALGALHPLPVADPATRGRDRRARMGGAVAGPGDMGAAGPAHQEQQGAPRAPGRARPRHPARVPRLAGSPLVFTTTGPDARSQGSAHAKARLDAAIVAARAKRAAEAGEGHAPPPLVPWRVHDFRRTGVTVLARKGVRWEVADRLLNHVGGRDPRALPRSISATTSWPSARRR